MGAIKSILFFAGASIGAGQNVVELDLRGLLEELARRGHRVSAFQHGPAMAEPDSTLEPSFRRHSYSTFDQLREIHANAIREADAVVICSDTHRAAELAGEIFAMRNGGMIYYDLETPVTVETLARKDLESITRELIPRFDLYLSVTGGPVLDKLEKEFGARQARPLYPGVAPENWDPLPREDLWDLGYCADYSPDRQAAFRRLFIQAAESWASGRFAAAGSGYPLNFVWPANIQRVDPAQNCARFYSGQKFAVTLARASFTENGWCPHQRLLEAALTGTPVITEPWEGLDEFFDTGDELLIARLPADLLRYARELPEAERSEIGQKGRQRVLSSHTHHHRAEQFEKYLEEITSIPEPLAKPLEQGEIAEANAPASDG